MVHLASFPSCLVSLADQTTTTQRHNKTLIPTPPIMDYTQNDFFLRTKQPHGCGLFDPPQLHHHHFQQPQQNHRHARTQCRQRSQTHSSEQDSGMASASRGPEETRAAAAAAAASSGDHTRQRSKRRRLSQPVPPVNPTTAVDAATDIDLLVGCAFEGWDHTNNKNSSNSSNGDAIGHQVTAAPRRDACDGAVVNSTDSSNGDDRGVARRQFFTTRLVSDPVARAQYKQRLCGRQQQHRATMSAHALRGNQDPPHQSRIEHEHHLLQQQQLEEQRQQDLQQHRDRQSLRQLRCYLVEQELFLQKQQQQIFQQRQRLNQQLHLVASPAAQPWANMFGPAVAPPPGPAQTACAEASFSSHQKETSPKREKTKTNRHTPLRFRPKR
eukprot:m.444709 g.444709  ORF g.444709 m.444709 type:complete len:383 (+) comp20300_c0_seq1:588-1736(+)